MPRHLVAAAVAAAAACGRLAMAQSPTGATVSQVYYSPESTVSFVGSPSTVRCGAALLASHDCFGACGNRSATAFVYSSPDNGVTWAPVGSADSMYWATLFVRAGDPAGTVYLMGTSSDGTSSHADVAVARSADCGVTWNTSLVLKWDHEVSTGPTPVLAAGGRLWRAFERNDGAWATGFGSFMMSAPDDSPDLLDPAAWSFSPTLDFSSVAGLVPPSWGSPAVVPAFGWLEGGAVELPEGTPGAVGVLLRVNSVPAANKAALLTLANATAAPVFAGWVDPFPGGMTKFSVRRDAVTGWWVTVSNNIEDDRVTEVPGCPALPQASVSAGSAAAAITALPCCSMHGPETADCTAGGAAATCVWCHGVSRNNLTLAVSPSLTSNWTVVATVMHDDTGLPGWASQIFTGFQYADWQLDGAGGGDIVAAVRASYRGARDYHDANRLLYTRVVAWRTLVGAGLAAAGEGALAQAWQDAVARGTAAAATA